ncbi:MAG: hypothetical protein HQK75_14730 [Candidatus Magnetomorum sp.]|nr:hypothetical protein [Candidatus Magnetomorum sp.]
MFLNKILFSLTAMGFALGYINSPFQIQEITINDVFFLIKEQNRSYQISTPTAQEILKHSGSHPRLITQCFDFIDDEGVFHHDTYIETQKMSPFVWQLFTPFI